MTVLLKFAQFTKENFLFLSLLCGFTLIQGGFMPKIAPCMLPEISALSAQEIDDDFGDEDELNNDEDFGDDDDFDDEEFDDEEGSDDEEFDDEEGSDDEEFDDEEGSDDEEFDDEDGSDEEEFDDEEGSDDEEEENADENIRTNTPNSKDEKDLLEQYQSDTLYSIKKYQYGDASIREILASNPQTVPELVAAAKDFSALLRFDLANLFYQKALDASPDEEDVTQLITDYGRAFFVSLAENRQLAPSGNAFAKYVLAQLENRFSSDPEFIQEMIEQLFSDDENERRVATTELMTYRSVALPALLFAYSEREDENELKVLAKVLLMFGDGLTSGASACLESGNEALQLACVELLKIQTSKMNPDSLTMLFYAAAIDCKNQEKVHKAALNALASLSQKDTLTKPVLGKILEGRIEKLQKEKEIIEHAGNDDSIEVIWQWNSEKETIVPMTGNRLMKYRLNSFRLSKAFWNLYPEYPKARKFLFLNTSEYVTTFVTHFNETELKTDQIIQTEEFKRLNTEFSLNEMEEYLTECLKTKFYDAAILALLALGEKGDASLLQPISARNGQVLDPTLCVSSTESYSPIIVALHAPHRLLRFSALQTIMKLNPQKPFPGSSRVTDTIAWFLRTDGHSKVLIADETNAEATILGGRFRQFGYAFQTATTTREVLEKALLYCDYSMILMNVRVLAANADLLLQQLALDPRTADVPIVLLAHPEDFKKAELLAQNIAKCIWFPCPSRDEDLKLLLSLAGRIQTSVNLKDEQRITETRAVLLWTRDIMRSHQGGWVQKMRFDSNTQNAIAKDPSILEDAANIATIQKNEIKTENPQNMESDETEDNAAENKPLENGTGDDELDSLLAAGENLPEVKEVKEASQTNEPQPNPTAEWDHEPLQLYDVSKLIPPVLQIYHYSDFLKESLEVLRWIGTPEAQNTLTFISTTGTFSYSASKRAAKILRENTLRYGVLMTTQQIGDLYDLFNSTPEKKSKLLEVRGLVLDALEAPLDKNSVPDLTLDEDSSETLPEEETVDEEEMEEELDEDADEEEMEEELDEDADEEEMEEELNEDADEEEMKEELDEDADEEEMKDEIDEDADEEEPEEDPDMDNFENIDELKDLDELNELDQKQESEKNVPEKNDEVPQDDLENDFFNE